MNMNMNQKCSWVGLAPECKQTRNNKSRTCGALNHERREAAGKAEPEGELAYRAQPKK